MQLLYQFILDYLVYRSAWNLGFLPFSNYRKIISFATGCSNIYYTRKIFLYLCSKGFFIKKKNIKRSYTYCFIKPIDLDQDKSVKFS